MFDKHLPCYITTQDAQLTEHAVNSGIQNISGEEILIREAQNKSLCIADETISEEILQLILDSNEWNVQIVIGPVPIQQSILKPTGLPFAPPQ